MLVRVLLAVAFSALLHAEPTALRDWKSTAGTTLSAVANGTKNGQVQFTAPNGRNLSVPLDKLAEADRAFLLDHFKIEQPKPGEPVASGAAPVGDLAHPLGKITGPIEADADTHYLLYLPTTLKKDRKAPILFFTHSGGGNAGNMKTMIEGAEVTGWITAASIESKNANDISKNHEFTNTCLKHISATLPVDEDRIYFTGSSGGAATAFYNAEHLDHAGVISSVGYIPDKAPKGGDYFITNGATDFNRYPSANSAEAVGKKKSILRYHEGGHGTAPAWLMTDAMLWLNLRHLSDKGSKLADERLDFEVGVLRWIEATKGAAPHRAYHAAVQMKETFKLSSANSAAYDTIITELGSEPNRRYAEGILVVDAWARKTLAPFGAGSRMKHTTPVLESSAKKLSEKLAGVPQLEEIALKLGQITGRL